MDPNDTQPGGRPSRTITIQLTRDTLILIAALVFLAVAILLAVLFPGQSPGPNGSTRTSVAQAATAQPASARQTALAIATDAGVEPTPSPSLPQGYPAPEEPIETPAATSSLSDGTDQGLEAPTAPTGASRHELTTTPAGDTQVVPTDIPIFSPSRPGLATSAVAGAAQSTPYPAPATPDTSNQPTNPGLIEPTPTSAPPTATPRPRQTATPRPTSQSDNGAVAVTPRPRAPQPTAAPTVVPIDIIRGNVRWTAAQSPIVLRRDLRLLPGARLIIEPGVEIRLAPGASVLVEGTLYALGTADRPVRFVGAEGQRWEGIFGRAGSDIALEHTEIRGGGNGGTVLTSEGGNLVLHNARVNDNGGHIQVNDSRLEVRDSEVAGNDMPYGSAIEATYGGGGGVILTGNRIGGNRMQPGTSPVRISNQSGIDTLHLDIQGNLLVGTQGPDLTLFANGPLQGGVTCNTLVGGPNGLSLRSDLPQVPGLAANVRDNAIEQHTPPIIPEYLKYGIGRGATSEVAIDLRNNWWGSPLGPYEPDRHADGRGQAVGDMVEFAPWLTERPACAPAQ